MWSTESCSDFKFFFARGSFGSDYKSIYQIKSKKEKNREKEVMSKI